MASANPAVSEAVYRRAGLAPSAAGVMTLQGAVGKTFILLVILIVVAGFAWS